VIGILVTFSPEFAKVLNIQGEVRAGDAIMYAYIGIALGDLATGALSQLLKSRLKVMYTFLGMSAVVITVYLNLDGATASVLYLVCGLLGFATGFWVIFVTIAAEQFGTNLRATVTTTVPNFVRGALPLLIILFNFLLEPFGRMGAATAVGVFVIVTSLLSVRGLKETFHQDLNYTEDV
jgi:hypothetical protein